MHAALTDHGRQDFLQHRSSDVEHIPAEPDDDKGDRKTFGGTSSEILDNLGGKDYNPTCNRY